LWRTLGTIKTQADHMEAQLKEMLRQNDNMTSRERARLSISLCR